jgi:hypothetical protein
MANVAAVNAPPVNNVPDYSIEGLTRAAEEGDVEEVHEILHENRHDEYFVEESDAAGFTPVTSVLIRGSQRDPAIVTTDMQIEVLRELRNFGADFFIPDNNGILPLFAALSADLDVVDYIAHHTDFDQYMGNRMNLLMAAASLGLLEVVENISTEFDVNAKDGDGNTALHHAVFQDVNQYTRTARSSAVEIVRVLCQSGADTSIENNAGQTPFQLALDRDMYDVTLELFHCDLPQEGFRQIGLQRGDETIHFQVHVEDTVLQVKQAFLGPSYRDFDFIYDLYRLPGGRLPRPAEKVMVNDRTFGDYDVKNNEVILIQPKLRSGFGGKRTRKYRKLRKTRKLRKN